MAAGGGAASLAALALAGLTAASAAAAAGGVGSGHIGSDDGAKRAGSDASEGSPRAGASAGAAASLFASGRGGFMQRAFARQAVPAGAGHGPASGPQDAGGGGSGSAGAFAVFQQRVREFNACVPYAGLSPGELWPAGLACLGCMLSDLQVLHPAGACSLG